MRCNAARVQLHRAALVLLGALGCAPRLQVLDVARAPRVDPDPGPQAAGPCDPLSSEPRAIALEGALAVGRSRSGDVYAVDRVGGKDARAYRGRDGVLWRQGNVSTSASSRGLDRYDAWVGGSSLRLLVDRTATRHGTVPTRHWGLFLTLPDEPRNPGGQRGTSAGVRLRRMPERSVRGWSIVDRAPPAIGIQYLARTPGDRWLLVTMPEPLGFEHLRVYFGPREDVRQRRLVDFARQRDGGTTRITFEVDGVELRARFPVRCGEPPPSGVWRPRHDCPGELSGGGEAAVLERVAGSDALKGLEVVCAP